MFIKITGNVNHCGVDLEIGREMSMPDEQAQALIDVNVAEKIADDMPVVEDIKEEAIEVEKPKKRRGRKPKSE